MSYFQPIVDEIKCEGCESCVENCPEEMFEMQGGKATVVTHHSCCYCQVCIDVCEQGAIKIEEF